MKRYFLLFTLIFLTFQVTAQSSFTEYSWTFADISFRYPSSWGEPVQRFATESGRVNMLLAQTAVDSPETRPPAIPFVTISLLREPSDDIDIYNELENDLEAVGIDPIGELPGTMLGRESLATRGISRDGEFFGIGQAIRLEDDSGFLIIYGRSTTAQRDNFVATFNAISNSVILSASNSAIQPEYGVLWHQNSNLLEGDDAFLDLGGIALAPDGHLYAVDNFQGLLQVDPRTGQIESQISLGDVLVITDIAIAPDNTIYISDLACNCIHVVVDGSQINTIGGFGIDSPESIAVTLDNTLYATDSINGEFIIRAIGANTTEITFDIQPFSQPFLTVDRSGELIGLVDSAIVYKIVDGIFTEQYQLASNVLPTAITVDLSNNLVLTSESEAVMVFDSQGNEINRIGSPSSITPQAGEIRFPQGVTSASDGTIYWVDGDGTSGNITAMSLSVESGRVGGTNIISGNVVQGILDNSISRQTWTFDAISGDIITLTAIADFLDSDLDLTIRLLDPIGQDVAFVDNPENSTLLNPFDPQIDNLTLRHDGQYIIIIESNLGIGRYSLGLNIAEIIDISSGLAMTTGTVSEVIPVQRWVFDGNGGQTAQITMTANSATLDPILILISSNGNLIAENDDALDSSLGLNAQIADVTLSSNGRYIVEARRFDGEGSYELNIEIE